MLVPINPSFFKYLQFSIVNISEVRTSSRTLCSTDPSVNCKVNTFSEGPLFHITNCFIKKSCKVNIVELFKLCCPKMCLLYSIVSLKKASQNRGSLLGDVERHRSLPIQIHGLTIKGLGDEHVAASLWTICIEHGLKSDKNCKCGPFDDFKAHENFTQSIS